MGRPKKGQRVTHSSTGESGIVSAVIRGVVYVVMRDGSTKSGYAGSFHSSKKGCLFSLILFSAISLGGAWAMADLLT